MRRGRRERRKMVERGKVQSKKASEKDTGRREEKVLTGAII
jgi:hypothetical protein